MCSGEICFSRRDADSIRSSTITVLDQHNILLDTMREQQLCGSLTENAPSDRQIGRDDELNSDWVEVGTIASHTPNNDVQQEPKDFEEILDAVSVVSEDLSEALSFYTPHDSLLDCTLETSERVHPEEYVIERQLNQLIIFSTTTVKQTNLRYLDKYFCIYAEDARHWKRIVLAVSRTAQQDLIEFSSTNPNNWMDISGSVRTKVQAILQNSETPLFESVTKIQLSNDPHPAIQADAVFNVDEISISEDVAEAAAQDTSQHVQQLRFQNISSYPEKRVAFLERLGPSLNIVNAGSVQCLERNIPFVANSSPEQSSINGFLEDMNLLRMAQGIPGVANFMGVVLSDDFRRLSGYLIRDHGGGRLFRVLQIAKREGMTISWEQKERWIRQLIEVVADIHKRGVILGDISNITVWMDSNDDIIVSSLVSRPNLQGWPGVLPPELREPTTNCSRQYHMTTQTDLFLLGRAIWMLAEESYSRITDFCSQAGCLSRPRFKCTADHANPIKLPLCKEVPAHIEQIITHCRQTDPYQRLPAAELLKLFPMQKCILHSNPINTTLRSRHCFGVDCHECGELTTDEFYKCHVCRGGNFDLCPRCFKTGIRCFNNDHELYLVTRRNGKGVSQTLVDTKS